MMDGTNVLVLTTFCGHSTLYEVAAHHSIREFVAALWKIVDNLLAIHMAGYVHNDVQPANIVFDN